MASSHFVKRVKAALEDLEVRIDRRTKNPKHPDGSGRVISALYEPEFPRATVYSKQCNSFDEMVEALLHEAIHHMPGLGQPENEWPEWLVSGGLEKVAAASPTLWICAATIIGDVLRKG